MRGVEVVFHLAALIAIPYSYRAPLSFVRTNVEGTLTLLQAAREAGVGRVVHTSTSEVYGTARYAPIDERHPLQGRSPYAASKIGADKMAEAFHLSFGLPVVTVRPFNTFGPRQSARAVIPTIIAQCLAGPVVRLGNAHPTRDLNYVANTVDGFLLAAAAPDAVGQAVNLGSGREIAIGELAVLIGRLMGREVRIETEERRLRPDGSEVDRLLADNGLARTLLGWRPGIGLEEGLEHTIDWMRSHAGRYRADAYVL
jgi:dTDP-glucose 4,6-dehydratase